MKRQTICNAIAATLIASSTLASPIASADTFTFDIDEQGWQSVAPQGVVCSVDSDDFELWECILVNEKLNWKPYDVPDWTEATWDPDLEAVEAFDYPASWTSLRYYWNNYYDWDYVNHSNAVLFELASPFLGNYAEWQSTSSTRLSQLTFKMWYDNSYRTNETSKAYFSVRLSYRDANNQEGEKEYKFRIKDEAERANGGVASYTIDISSLQISRIQEVMFAFYLPTGQARYDAPIWIDDIRPVKVSTLQPIFKLKPLTFSPLRTR